MLNYKPQILNRYWDGLLSIFYPKQCLACGNTLVRGEEVACTMCLYSIRRTNYHKDKENPVAKLFYGRIDPVFASSHFGFDKGGILQELMHQLKYKDHQEVGFLLGQHAGLGLKQSPHLPEVDYIVPVPLHPKKMKYRGYNQSACIAKGMAKVLKANVDTSALIRTTYASSQTKLTREQRWSNVANNFKLTSDEKFRSKHILLVDDVLTTGATLESCYETLSQTPDIRISIATLARAQ